MFCPQCGTESSSSYQYCRSCGANLKVIAKAVSLSEAIARSDRGPLPKIKEALKSLKVEQVTEDVSRAFEQVKHEIARSADTATPKPKPNAASVSWRRPPLTPEQRRERSIGKGIRLVFTGVGLSVFLHNFASAIVLKIPPPDLARIPLELEPVIQTLWLVGAVPVFSGLGRIVSGLLIRPSKQLPAAPLDEAAQLEEARAAARKASLDAPAHSVTDHTTELLQQE